MTDNTKQARLGLAAVLVAGVVFAMPASADEIADFYKGKTITVLSGFGAGGMYGIYTGVINKHMPRHIPGNPTMIGQFMPGAGGVKAANFFHSAAPKDGSMMGMLSQAIALTQMLKAGTNVRYDAGKMHWLGSIDGVTNILSVWNGSTKVRTMEDLQKEEVIVGVTGKGSIGYMNMALTKSVLGAQLKIVAGYNNLPMIDKAFETGELQGRAATWISIKTRKQEWMKPGVVTQVVQFGLKKHPDLPNVPLAQELATDDADKRILEFAASPSTVGRALSLPPGTPAARVAALRKAFTDTMKDPEFLKEAHARKLPILWSTGEEVAAVIERTVATPPELVNRVKDIVASGGVK
jgi:tripartite-type tricarboxylate transporter receptor subunit TctC